MKKIKSPSEKNTVSTFDRIMKDPERKKKFDEGYNEFLLSELLLALMEDDEISVRALAKEAGVSPTVIQDMRSGKKDNITLKKFSDIMKSLGYKIYVKKGRKSIPISN
jgi:DNA-binding Xre family transcriptional regulator